MTNYIGEKIKEYRKKKGLLQEDLAKMVGISRVALGNYERGTRTPSATILNKIAAALEASISEFVLESPLRKIQSEISSKQELIQDLIIKSKENFDIRSPILEELETNPNDEDLKNRLKSIEEELKAVSNLIEYTRLEIAKLRDTERKVFEIIDAENKEFGGTFIFEEVKNQLNKPQEYSIDSNRGTLYNSLLNKFDRLNIKGKKEAVKRVDELTQILTYTRDETLIANNDEVD